MPSYTLKIGNDLKEQRLDRAVHALLSEKIPGGISKSMARKLVMIGAAYLNGSRCRIASKPVFKGSEIRVEYNPEKIRPIQLEFPTLSEKDILYKEGGLIVVNKPANMPTVPTLDNARDNLVAALKILLGRPKDLPVSPSLDPAAADGRPDASVRTGKDQYLGERTDRPPEGETKRSRVERSPSTSDGHGGHESTVRTTRSSPSTVYIGIHHRLDAPTSGCILFTLDENMNSFVAGLFQESLIQKEYLAICNIITAPPGEKWEIKNQLERAEKKRNIYRSTTGEGDFAYSRFELLEKKGDLALIKAMPITGRTHQLRVHLSESGLPVLGDRTYKGTDATRLMLHAHKLKFRLPDGRDVVVEAPAPQEFKRLFTL